MSIRDDHKRTVYERLEDSFKFPSPIPLERRLKDVLDTEVDEKYYLSDEQTKRLRESTFNQQKARENTPDSIVPTVCARDYKDPQCVRVGGLYDTENSRHQAGSVYDPKGIAATLSTMQGGNQEPIIVASRGRNPDNPSDRTVGAKTEQRLEPNLNGTTNTITSVQKDNYVAIKTANKCGYDLATDGDGVDLAYPDSKTRRGRVRHGVAKTLPTSDSQGVLDNCRIRKLTPKECWRLMGFGDDDFYKAQEVNSNSQLYKQAGNSIVVNVLEAILKELLDGSAD